MGIIDKLSGSSHHKETHTHKNVDSGSTAYDTPRLDERTGTSTSSTTDRTTEEDRRVMQAAPIVQTRVHDLYEHVDKQRNEELHEKTRVEQIVQPVYDERREGVQHERVDHGTEVHEHGEKGLTREAEAELARKREEIARAHQSTRDESVTETNARTDADVQVRKHKIEEVVPVLERDIYRPHEIVHDKKVVDIYHDGVDGVHTRVNEPVSISEFERTHGTRLQGASTTTSTDYETRGTSRSEYSTSGSGRNSTNNIVNDTNSTGYTTGTSTHSDAYDNRNSSDANTTGKKKVGLGEKIEHVAEKVTHKDLDHDGDVAGKPKMGNTSNTHTGNKAF